MSASDDTVCFNNTQFQVNRVTRVQDRFGVKITIQKTPPDVCIRIEGRHADTAQTEIVNNIFSNFIVCENAKTEVNNSSCDLLCKKQVTFSRK